MPWHELGNVDNFSCMCAWLEELLRPVTGHEHYIYDVMKYELLCYTVRCACDESDKMVVERFRYDVVAITDEIRSAQFRVLPEKVTHYEHMLVSKKTGDRVTITKTAE